MIIAWNGWSREYAHSGTPYNYNIEGSGLYMDDDKCIFELVKSVQDGTLTELEAERLLNAAARFKAGVATNASYKAPKNGYK